ncbi:hypothetical protein [Roseateles sp. L2-2]|uniref:nSTAND3 domain-containing NTPase n=1 Tax=Roseateles sp. L2-2 TaxID=3422597 RepID=UPI003D36C6F4
MIAEDGAGRDVPEAGGSASLVGYFYQAKVSVWVALDLLLRTRSTDSIELEPANHEDIRADLGDEDSPAAVGGKVKVASRTLQVQIKWRSTTVWNVSSLNTLLRNGKDRASASKLLEDASVSYLLITNAAVNGEAKGNVVRRLDGLPGSAEVAKGLLQGHPDRAVSGRVAIREMMDEEKLDAFIQRLLTETCKVPWSRWKACFNELNDEVLARMARPIGRGWSREEVEEVIHRHEGYLAPSAELDLYVRPSNWAQLITRLKVQHAVVLHGPSGTGKSITSRALEAELRVAGDALEVRRVREAHEVDLHRSAPTLYVVDDPWGKNGFEAHTAAWNEDLPHMLRAARENLKFIVTSRDDVMYAAGASQVVGEWQVALERQQYSEGQWDDMYQRRLSTLPRDVQEIAHTYQYLPLEKLTTPFEMQVFFDELRKVRPSPRGSVNKEHVEGAIKASQRQRIEELIASQMEQRNEVREAICVWGIFIAFKALTYEELGTVVDSLCELRDEAYEKVEDVVSFLAAGHRLRQVENVLDFHHPSVESGLQKVVLKNPRPAKGVLVDLLQALMATSHPELGAAWGESAAARLAVAARRLDKLRFSLPVAVQANVDALLERQLISANGDLTEALKLMVDAGSPDTVLSHLSRLLLERTTYNPFEKPRAPIALEPSEAALLREHPSTARIVERYIEEVLPVDRGPFRDGLTKVLQDLAGPTPNAYINAAIACVKGGDYTDGSGDVFAEAVKDLDLAEQVVHVAVAEAQSFKEWGDQEGIRNGFYNEQYEEYHDQFAGESWYGLSAWLDQFVSEWRSHRDWRELAKKPYALQVLNWWLRSASGIKAGSLLYPGEEEFHFLLERTLNTTHESAFWEMASGAWYASADTALLHRLYSPPEDVRLFHSAASCLVKAAPHLFERLKVRLTEEGNDNQLVEVVVALDEVLGHPEHPHARRSFDSDEDWEDKERVRELDGALLSQWLSGFEAVVAELLRAVVAPPGPGRTLSEEARELLRTLRLGSEQGRLWRLETATQNGCSSAADFRNALEFASSNAQVTRCVELAARAGEWVVVEEALSHPYSKAQATAIKAIASRDSDELSAGVLALRSSRSRFVKSALLDAIESRIEPRYLDDLVALAGDKWEEVDPNNDFYYPYARRAARLLAQLGAAVAGRTKELLEIAKSTEDYDLRSRLLKLNLEWGRDEDLAAVLALVSERTPQGLGAATAKLCVEFHQRFSPALVVGLTPPFIAAQPLHIASALVLLVGVHGTSEAVEELAVSLGSSPRRRVFLVLLALATGKRAALREAVCSLLPAQHSCLQLFLPEPAVIARSALDDLGPPDAVELVLRWLGTRVEPKAPAEEPFER